MSRLSALKRYVILFVKNSERYVLTYYEWRLGHISHGAWSAPKYTFRNSHNLKKDEKIILYDTEEEAKRIARNLFQWDDGYDCGTIQYFIHKNDDGSSYEIKPQDIKIIELTYAYESYKVIS